LGKKRPNDDNNNDLDKRSELAMDLDSWIEPTSVDFRVTKNAAAASSVTTGTWVAGDDG
jgi:hypothetical protein